MSTELDEHLRSKSDPDQPPPVLGSWKRFYAVVIVNTIIVYGLLLLFSYYAAQP